MPRCFRSILILVFFSAVFSSGYLYAGVDDSIPEADAGLCLDGKACESSLEKQIRELNDLAQKTNRAEDLFGLCTFGKKTKEYLKQLHAKDLLAIRVRLLKNQLNDIRAGGDLDAYMIDLQTLMDGMNLKELEKAPIPQLQITNNNNGKGAEVVAASVELNRVKRVQQFCERYILNECRTNLEPLVNYLSSNLKTAAQPDQNQFAFTEKMGWKTATSLKYYNELMRNLYTDMKAQGVESVKANEARVKKIMESGPNHRLTESAARARISQQGWAHPFDRQQGSEFTSFRLGSLPYHKKSPSQFIQKINQLAEFTVTDEINRKLLPSDIEGAGYDAQLATIYQAVYNKEPKIDGVTPAAYRKQMLADIETQLKKIDPYLELPPNAPIKTIVEALNAGDIPDKVKAYHSILYDRYSSNATYNIDYNGKTRKITGDEARAIDSTQRVLYGEVGSCPAQLPLIALNMAGRHLAVRDGIEQASSLANRMNATLAPNIAPYQALNIFDLARQNGIYKDYPPAALQLYPALESETKPQPARTSSRPMHIMDHLLVRTEQYDPLKYSSQQVEAFKIAAVVGKHKGFTLDPRIADTPLTYGSVRDPSRGPQIFCPPIEKNKLFFEDTKQETGNIAANTEVWNQASEIAKAIVLEPEKVFERYQMKEGKTPIIFNHDGANYSPGRNKLGERNFTSYEVIDKSTGTKTNVLKGNIYTCRKLKAGWRPDVEAAIQRQLRKEK